MQPVSPQHELETLSPPHSVGSMSPQLNLRADLQPQSQIDSRGTLSQPQIEVESSLEPGEEPAYPTSSEISRKTDGQPRKYSVIMFFFTLSPRERVQR